MNITIKTTKERQVDRVCGGEYAICNLEIYISKDMTLREKQEVIIHAIIENWNRSWEHTKVEELTEKIMEGLDQFGGMMLDTQQLKNALIKIQESTPCPYHGKAYLAICTECLENVVCQKCSLRGCQCWNDK